MILQKVSVQDIAFGLLSIYQTYTLYTINFHSSLIDSDEYILIQKQCPIDLTCMWT